MKIKINFWSKNNNTRFYVNDENGNSLGYFQEVAIDKANFIFSIKSVDMSEELE